MSASPSMSPNDSQVSTVIAVVSCVLFVAFLAVAMRVYARAVLISQFGMDDYASIVSFVFVFICGFFVAWNTRFGFGTHVAFLTEEQIRAYLKIFYISVVFYNVAMGAIKTTFLLQYYRVFARPMVRNVIIGAGVVIGGWSTSQIFLAIFACTPVSAFWTGEGTCIDNLPAWYVNATGNIITDLIVLILPLPVIKNLNLASRQKIILLGVFCLGFLTCAISFVRIRFLKLSQDFTWTNVEAAAWSISELCSALTCVCLPTLRPLISHHFPGLLSSRGTSSQKTHYPNPGSGAASTGPGELGPGDRSRRTLQRTESNDELYGTLFSLTRSDSSLDGQHDSVPSASSKGMDRFQPDRNLAKVTTCITGSQSWPQGGKRIHESSIEIELEITQAISQETENKDFS
ncbi:hypothetical protein BGZ61DRAFT_466937 [Ilyonectria robusta]|uniref:uncharacterized protein n=1 Tax=Ilyonectria robusta TaxID=1079257 RepID=UPI001E8E57D9|nr:uncharacterized protein BGZ61DRAFT_466937 [Ilyonectria robusta]KAH8656277.1 hypothetical protein BGZ61DRAFT_466937 [Ilyonectria robusta]